MLQIPIYSSQVLVCVYCRLWYQRYLSQHISTQEDAEVKTLTSIDNSKMQYFI